MEKRYNHLAGSLWSTADQLRANSNLKSHEYSSPVLGLIFLRYADHKFTHAQKEVKKAAKWVVGRVKSFIVTVCTNEA